MLKNKKSQDKPKVLKITVKKRDSKRSLYMFLQKSDDEINTARTDDRRVQKQANKVYSESNPYRTGVGDSLPEETKKRNDRRKLNAKINHNEL
jgi:hypothetical protein